MKEEKSVAQVQAALTGQEMAEQLERVRQEFDAKRKALEEDYEQREAKADSDMKAKLRENEEKLDRVKQELLDNHVGGGVAVRRGQHEKIDVRQWCQLAAAVASHRDKRKSGIAMPRHDDGKKRFQKLVHSQRMPAHIDSPVAPLFEFGGKVVFQRAVDILCRREEGGTERLVIFVTGEPMQGRQPVLRYRQLAVPRRLKRLDPLPPPHDLAGAVRAGRPPCHSLSPGTESVGAGPSSSRSS